VVDFAIHGQVPPVWTLRAHDPRLFPGLADIHNALALGEPSQVLPRDVVLALPLLEGDQLDLRSMKHALLLLLAGIVVICAIRPASSQDLHPGIIGEDDRVRLEEHGPPWDAVGQVNVAGFRIIGQDIGGAEPCCDGSTLCD